MDYESNHHGLSRHGGSHHGKSHYGGGSHYHGQGGGGNYDVDSRPGGLISVHSYATDHHHRQTRRKGCDPLRSEVRAQLQVKRMEINDQLNKQLMLKQGCENLARAAAIQNVHKTRDIAIIELSFVNSSLQLLRDELQETNGTIIPFQSNMGAKSIPMIPIGLRVNLNI